MRLGLSSIRLLTRPRSLLFVALLISSGFFQNLVYASLSSQVKTSALNVNVWTVPQFVKVRVARNVVEVPQKFKTENYLILPAGKGLFDVIIEVPFRNYVAGVISKEMPLSWPLEALKAQAIIARSYTLARIAERSAYGFHVESDQNDQVYEKTFSAKAYQANDETENMILTQINGPVLKAFYHSDCGGQTLPAYAVWTDAGASSKTVYNSGTAKDPWCLARKSNEWEFETTLDNLKDALEARADFVTSDPIWKVEKYKNKLIQIQNVSVQTLREALGYSVIRSAPSSISVENDVLHLKGKGFGHGVGLCQWGARHLALKGHSFQEILSHYYPQAELKNIFSLNQKNSLTKK